MAQRTQFQHNGTVFNKELTMTKPQTPKPQSQAQLRNGRYWAAQAGLEEAIMPNGNRCWLNRKALEEDPHMMAVTVKFLGGTIQWANSH